GQGLAGDAGWYSRFAQGLLFVIGMMFFARLMLIESGLHERYQACQMALRLAERNDWPADLSACLDSVELRAFCEALRGDSTPAFALLGNPRPQARLAGLTALDGKRDWLPGQAEMVAEVLRRAEEAEVREAALRVLAPLPERRMVEKLASYLRDPVPQVRR